MKGAPSAASRDCFGRGASSNSSIDFGGVDDHLWTVGADALVDTRADPNFPRNAFLLGAGWTGLHFRNTANRIDRYNTDARGYVGLIGQAVGAARVQYTSASGHLPDYERILLGGASTLRGFRTGTFDGDRTLVTSAEVRLPITSVLSSARLGVLGFFDAAKAWDFGSRFEDAAWHRGVGGGLFLIAPIVKLNLDVAQVLRERARQSAGYRFARAERLARAAPLKLWAALVLAIAPCTFVVLSLPIAHMLARIAG